MRVFPNPFNQAATISFPNSGKEPCTLVLTDLSGKVCRIVDNVRTSEYLLRKESLRNGVYFLEIKGSETYRTKLLIE